MTPMGRTVYERKKGRCWRQIRKKEGAGSQKKKLCCGGTSRLQGTSKGATSSAYCLARSKKSTFERKRESRKKKKITIPEERTFTEENFSLSLISQAKA